MSPGSSRARRYVAGCLTAAMGVITLPSTGCFPPKSLPQFPGLYNVTRGQAKLTIGWVIGQDKGEVNYVAAGGQFEPVDANELPDELQEFAEDWNAGLAELNDNIDVVFPNQVVISHSQPWLIAVTSPDDPNLGFQGLNGPDAFVALSVGAQFGTVGASVLSGQWDGQDTVTGDWSVGWGVADAGAPGGPGLIVTTVAVIPYEAVLVP